MAANRRLVPRLLGLPKLENHDAPRLKIVGDTAMVSTFVTVVGHPKTPTFAGKEALTLVALLAFQGFYECCFFPTDVGTSTTM